MDIEACDDTSNDTFEVFNLTSQNADVLQGQNPSIYLVSYHNTLLDSKSGENQKLKSPKLAHIQLP